MRKRLQRTPKPELLEAIRSFTEEVSNYYGNWAKDVFAYETVRHVWTCCWPMTGRMATRCRTQIQDAADLLFARGTQRNQ